MNQDDAPHHEAICTIRPWSVFFAGEADDHEQDADDDPGPEPERKGREDLADAEARKQNIEDQIDRLKRAKVRNAR